MSTKREADEMKRRDLLAGAVALAALSAGDGSADFPGTEPGIAELQAQMTSGRLTSRTLVRRYLKRIAEVDRKLKSVLETNPDALAIAGDLDRERKKKGPRGPLHGIPILVKDNIGTADRMMTTAGSLALEGWTPPEDAFLIQRLRAAGAVILGKTNLSEWANFRSSRSSSGWSGRGGQTRNPHALDRDPSGSSSGSGAAVAAGLCAAAVGTETDGSIVSPSNACGVVGIKPTLGLVSRSGVIPLSHSQDTAGPMARSVADAAALLAAMAGPDPGDSATGLGEAAGLRDYHSLLDRDGLRGARLGVVRQFVGGHKQVDAIFEQALQTLRSRGAILIDLKEIPNLRAYGDTEFQVLLWDFKADINAYLSRLPSRFPHTLADLIAFNEREKEREMPYFAQETFIQAEAKGPLTDQAYKDALERNHRLSRIEGVDVVFREHNLDAVIAPTGGPAGLTDLIYGSSGSSLRSPSSMAAVSGYPHITVPAGAVFGLPVGLSFIGPAWSDARLIRFAYAYERETRKILTPRLVPSARL